MAQSFLVRSHQHRPPVFFFVYLSNIAVGFGFGLEPPLPGFAGRPGLAGLPGFFAGFEGFFAGFEGFFWGFLFESTMTARRQARRRRSSI